MFVSGEQLVQLVWVNVQVRVWEESSCTEM